MICAYDAEKRNPAYHLCLPLIHPSLHLPQQACGPPPPAAAAADLPPTPAATLSSSPALLLFRVEAGRAYWDKLLAQFNGNFTLQLIY